MNVEDTAAASEAFLLMLLLLLLLLALALALGFGLNSLTTFPVLEIFENPRALLSVMMRDNKTAQAPFSCPLAIQRRICFYSYITML